MLKDIRIHLLNDEQEQAEIEEKNSADIQRNHLRNIQAFAENIPSLLPSVQNITAESISVFVNKNGEYNIVDYGQGRTLYGVNPNKEIIQHIFEYSEHANYIDFDCHPLQISESESKPDGLDILETYQKHLSFKPLSKRIEVLVVFGIGLGTHLKYLIENYEIKHLVIYEPEEQYFHCSILALNWAHIFSEIKSKNTNIYLQLGKDGRDLLADMQELKSHFNIPGFYYYKHYNHPVFNKIHSALLNENWRALCKKGVSIEFRKDPNQYLPHWTEGVKLDSYSLVNQSRSDLFSKNLAAFKTYFPKIYSEFKEYQPKYWIPITSENSEVNLLHKELLATLYGASPKEQCNISAEFFKRFPNKDGLVLGYTGTKLKHYTHYKFVAKTESFLANVDEKAQSLPKNIKSLIVFGLGVGYQLENLLNSHTVENLFICEPNRDFFYSSLFALDWVKILDTVNKTGGRLYINIGDDGRNLFRDLLQQFYSIGPYILASTYFYQGYFNTELVEAVAQLREQLQIVISMGEYYDHARYGIAHTIEGICRNYPMLKKDSESTFNRYEKQLPVFFIGNGPSLDYGIEYIKQYRDSVILVSCGTALMPLYKNRIVPDFHAEIEQNRSTFDWCSRAGSSEYLKQISLISCNGIHPDTCDLFKDVYIAFKEGESSTVSSLEILGRANYEELQYSFPTVCNFALNVFTKLGFNQLYLFGVDLGFNDQAKHHSKQSGYYNESGKGIYNYAMKNNTSLTTKGNFRKTVFTKHEFKVSRTIIEQLLVRSKVDCYNCSDGAFIRGTQALDPELILLSEDPLRKATVLNKLKSEAFTAYQGSGTFSDAFSEKFMGEGFIEDLRRFVKLAQNDFESKEQVEAYVDQQKHILFKSYSSGRSLLFYLLYGTVNYVNSVFLKICTNEVFDLQDLNLIRGDWLACLEKIKRDVSLNLFEFDYTSTLATQRELSHIKQFNAQFGMWASSRLSDMIKEQTQNLLGHPIEQTTELSPLKYKTWAVIVTSHEDLVTLNSQFCQEKLFSQSDGNSFINHIYALVTNLEYVDFLKNMVAGTLTKLSCVLFVDYIKEQNDLVLFEQSKKPWLFESNYVWWLLKLMINKHKPSLLIPKMFYSRIEENNFLESKQETAVLSELQAYKGFYEFHDYLGFDDNAGEYHFVDSVGNRGIWRDIVELDSKLFVNDFTKKETLELMKPDRQFY
ncbi:DUF115 domain-containing protein [Catenovulum sp. 2E275]|uniref:6-hydroxymethylpterin diphosphokinase MptE-like protein n=1 Tax=Catenovulum sp. 2E275 TaxID=2980497 RepID=UPI0021D0011A|nr:6-hydroxymethylpterin diphosphokinase MptE-like protein [Catenovulum sp. 2E275]MCU4674747.1 DUF115 domain-containing protein [Catenovulum sp. 2E275]